MAFWDRETRTKESEESIVDRAFASWSEARREKDDESVATVLTLTHKMNDAREALKAAEKSLKDTRPPDGKKVFVKGKPLICSYCKGVIWDKEEEASYGDPQDGWVYNFYCKVCQRRAQIHKEYGDGDIRYKYTITSSAEYSQKLQEDNERYRKEQRALESDETIRFD